jgi:hypothetical protein
MRQGVAGMIPQAVNWLDEKQKHFWCPLCEKKQSRIGIVSPWISPEGKLVCYYLLCLRCANRVNGQSLKMPAGFPPQRVELADVTAGNLLEWRLVKHYPFIAENLPENYFSEVSS